MTIITIDEEDLPIDFKPIEKQNQSNREQHAYY